MHSKVTSKGQITIPKRVRKELKIKTGDTVDFIIENGRVSLVPITKTSTDVFGILSGGGATPRTVEEINELLKNRIGERNR